MTLFDSKWLHELYIKVLRGGYTPIRSDTGDMYWQIILIHKNKNLSPYLVAHFDK